MNGELLIIRLVKGLVGGFIVSLAYWFIIIKDSPAAKAEGHFAYMGCLYVAIVILLVALTLLCVWTTCDPGCYWFDEEGVEDEGDLPNVLPPMDYLYKNMDDQEWKVSYQAAERYMEQGRK